MKLRTVKCGLLAVTFSMLAVGLSTIVHATPALSVKADGGCGLFDGDGNVVSSASFQVVVTYSKTGVAHVSCLAKGLANSTGKAVHYDACNNPTEVCMPCSFEYDNVEYSTYNLHETVSASGNANLKCYFEDELP